MPHPYSRQKRTGTFLCNERVNVLPNLRALVQVTVRILLLQRHRSLLDSPRRCRIL